MVLNNPFGEKYNQLNLPDETTIVRMSEPKVIENVQQAMQSSLESPIESDSLKSIALKKKQTNNKAKAIIVVSDNTRPVPYKGKDGILVPILDILLDCGYSIDEITIIVANGTHRAMTDDELRTMLDEKVFNLGIKVVNHDCRNDAGLVFIGRTHRNTEVLINKLYMDADLKIATGLIESHFMAGASGGRKAICPGLIGEKTTYIFHGAKLMADPKSTDLIIESNPVHEESLEVAKMASVDFLVNVTLNHDFKITGIFCGDLEKAHLQGVEKIKSVVQVESPKADIVITHGGFVGINHYQCAKCAVASLGILKENGYLIIMADTTDAKNKIGSLKYKISLALLKETGAKNFLKTICSPDWTFLPDQWQVQQWAKVFMRIPQNHMYLYSPQLDDSQWETLPGINGASFVDDSKDKKDCFNNYLDAVLKDICKRDGKSLDSYAISYIADGPYVVPKSK